MKKKHIGNGSSKYDFDNGASLDADVAETQRKYKQLHDDIINAYRISGLQDDALRIVIVEIYEELGLAK